MQYSKGLIRNPIRMGLLLEFNSAFPDEKPLSVEQYLKGGSKEIILNVAAFLLGFKSHESKYNDNDELLRVFFGDKNKDFAYKLHLTIKSLEAKGTKVGIINPYSSLTLFEYFFNKPIEEETQSHDEFEVNFFKAYLILNTEYTEKQHKAFDSTENLDKEIALPMMMFSMNYPVSDKHHYDINEIWITQLLKATLLFKFLENDERTIGLYQAFLSHFNVESWQEYLKSLIPLTLSMTKNTNESHTDFHVPVGEGYDRACAFLDKLIIENEEDINEYDFLTLRSKPFYKVKDGVYRIIFNLFVVEKIFKGMYFLLRDANNSLSEEKQVKSLKGLYGDFFSERVLLYDTIEAIFPDKCIKYSGQELVKMRISGGPDYYVRKYKDILVFESKDFLIPADAKMSFDFARYQDEFEKKLYFENIDGKEKHIGVMQLIAFIKKLLTYDFPADMNYHYREVSIYPIIVVHDHQYNVPGFNTLINYWFQAELEILKEEKFYIEHVKPLVIINIDSLIYHQVGLQESIPLNRVLEKYTKHIHKVNHLAFRSEEDMKAYVLSKQVAFSTFINEYFHDEDLKKMPPILEIVAPMLFKSDDLKDNSDNDFPTSHEYVEPRKGATRHRPNFKYRR